MRIRILIATCLVISMIITMVYGQEIHNNDQSSGSNQLRKSNRSSLRTSNQSSLRDSGRLAYPIVIDLDSVHTYMRQQIDTAVKAGLYPDFPIGHQQNMPDMQQIYALLYTEGAIKIHYKKYCSPVYAQEFLESLEEIYTDNLKYYGTKVQLDDAERENFFADFKAKIEIAKNVKMPSLVQTMNTEKPCKKEPKIDLHWISLYLKHSQNMEKPGEHDASPAPTSNTSPDLNALVTTLANSPEDHIFRVRKPYANTRKASTMTTPELIAEFAVIFYASTNPTRKYEACSQLEQNLRDLIKKYNLFDSIKKRLQPE